MQDGQFTYDGEFREGMKWGFGTLTESNGNRYVGEWLRDEMSGRGQFNFGKR